MPSMEENATRIVAYYAARAPEYHETTGYGTEDTEERYRRLKAVYQTVLKDHDVLEIASGTGYWTEVAARTARTVLATDIVPALVDRTRQRVESFPNVRCQISDAYTLESVSGPFSAAFAQHWLSHVPRSRLRSFLETLHSKLQPGASVFFSDDLPYDAGQLQRRLDEHGDMYEQRLLLDGSSFETIKNFPSSLELIELLSGISTDLCYSEYEPEHLWALRYHVTR
jgi:SAM-dependent methyltransferase